MIPPQSVSRSRPGAWTLLAAVCALLALAAAAFAAPPARRAAIRPAKPALPALADFAALSGAQAQACAAPLDPRLAALGEPGLRQCAWSQHVEMLYWPRLALPTASCLPPAAIAWQRLAATARTRFAAWDTAWPSQALFNDGAGARQAFALWRSADGAWSAAVWRWQPSDKPATRAWQERHWSAVAAAAGAYAARSAPPTPLQQAWLDTTQDKPRVLDGDQWRWVAQDACLALQTGGIGQAQLHMPWSRDDARLEQRSAMQVQLARRFPDADWLVPFTLIDPATPGNRSSAKFLAVWRQGAAINGQLWMPQREGGGVLRARVTSALPPNGPTAGPTAAPTAAREDVVKRRADLLERELVALAHAWEARHD